MENVVNVPRNRGALPRDYEELQITESLDENETLEEPTPPAETDKQDEPYVYTHVRVPELRRGGTRILMGITAASGAVSGAVMALTGAAEPAALAAISETFAGTVGELFLRALAAGLAFLAAELILGFFAFGDWLVWIIPLCCAMGASLRVAAAEEWILLPSAAAEICAVTLAAVTSANLSKTLMRLSKGGTVYLDRSPRRSCALAFLGYALVVAASAVYEGIALNRI